MSRPWVRFILLLGISWISMTTTHELGHLAGGWIGGATLTKCDLVPWHLPYSLHSPDPHPLLTLWAGPILGVAFPLAVAVIRPHAATTFGADFCLLANGVYLALAWFAGDRFLDTPRLLAEGAWPLSIGIYCFVCIMIGYVRFRDDCILLFSNRSNNPSSRNTT